MPDDIEIHPARRSEYVAAGAATARAYTEFATPGSAYWEPYLARIADVAGRGDRALKDYTLKFDRLDLDRAGFKVTAEEIAAARDACAGAANPFLAHAFLEALEASGSATSETSSSPAELRWRTRPPPFNASPRLAFC